MRPASARGSPTLDELLNRAADFDKLSAGEKFSWFQEQANSLTSELKAEVIHSHEHNRDHETCETRVLNAGFLAGQLREAATTGSADLYRKLVCEIYELGFTVVDCRKQGVADDASWFDDDFDDYEYPPFLHPWREAFTFTIALIGVVWLIWWLATKLWGLL